MLVVLQAFVKKPPRGLSVRYRQYKREALREVAWYWHSQMLARHFTPGNTTRYRMKPRNRFYKNVIKKQVGEGQGRFVDLLLMGRSLRWMKSFAAVTGNAYSATLRMKAPGYFSRPFIGSFTDPQTGRRKVITQQPDKPSELKQISGEDRKDMVRFIRRSVVEGFNRGSVLSGKTTR